MGLALNGPFREVIGFGSSMLHRLAWAIVWDPKKAIDIGEWSICGGGWLERFYCTLSQCLSCFLQNKLVSHVGDNGFEPMVEPNQ